MLYPLLHRLRRLGYVTTEWRTPPEGRRRRYYAITDDGRAALADQQRQWVAVTRALNDVWPGSGGSADGARGGVSDGEPGVTDRRVAGLRRKAPAVNGHDVDELEDHLRHQIAELTAAGLTADEAFLDRREADGRPRHAVPGVRTRAQRPTLEAARPERRGRAGARVERLARGVRLRRSRGRRDPDRTPRCRLPRRGADLVRAEPRSVRVAVPGRVLRPPAAARRRRHGR